MPDEKGATPPKGGRMDREVMRQAAELPVEGEAATDTLAASGGLELPGRVTESPTDEQRADRIAGEADEPPTAASVKKIERATRTENR